MEINKEIGFIRDNALNLSNRVGLIDLSVINYIKIDKIGTTFFYSLFSLMGGSAEVQCY